MKPLSAPCTKRRPFRPRQTHLHKNTAVSLVQPARVSTPRAISKLLKRIVQAIMPAVSSRQWLVRSESTCFLNSPPGNRLLKFASWGRRGRECIDTDHSSGKRSTGSGRGSGGDTNMRLGLEVTLEVAFTSVYCSDPYSQLPAFQC